MHTSIEDHSIKNKPNENIFVKQSKKGTLELSYLWNVTCLHVLIFFLEIQLQLSPPTNILTIQPNVNEISLFSPPESPSEISLEIESPQYDITIEAISG